VNERFIDLETRIAFMEEAIDGLNRALANQQKDMAKMAGDISRLGALIRELNPSPVDSLGREPPPPHY